MRVVDFLTIYLSASLTSLYVNSKPVDDYSTASFNDDAIKVKKRNEDLTTGYLKQCDPVAFPMARIGVVNVLAFLDSSWPYSHRQAAMLKTLNDRLRRSGLPDADFFVVNVDPLFRHESDSAEEMIEKETWIGVSADEIERFSEIERTADSLRLSVTPDIKFIQDSEDIGIWKNLRGSRDQVLVIDRCGKLTYQVIVPWSILHFPYVKAAILSTYKDEPCGHCDHGDDAGIALNQEQTITRDFSTSIFSTEIYLQNDSESFIASDIVDTTESNIRLGDDTGEFYNNSPESLVPSTPEYEDKSQQDTNEATSIASFVEFNITNESTAAPNLISNKDNSTAELKSVKSDEFTTVEVFTAFPETGSTTLHEAEERISTTFIGLDDTDVTSSMAFEVTSERQFYQTEENSTITTSTPLDIEETSDSADFYATTFATPYTNIETSTSEAAESSSTRVSSSENYTRNWGNEAALRGDDTPISGFVTSGNVNDTSQSSTTQILSSENYTRNWENEAALREDDTPISNIVTSGNVNDTSESSTTQILSSENCTRNWEYEAALGGDDTPISNIVTSGNVNDTSESSTTQILSSENYTRNWEYEAALGGDDTPISSIVTSGNVNDTSESSTTQILSSENYTRNWEYEAALGGDDTPISNIETSGNVNDTSESSTTQILSSENYTRNWEYEAALGGDDAPISGFVTSGNVNDTSESSPTRILSSENYTRNLESEAALREDDTPMSGMVTFGTVNEYSSTNSDTMDTVTETKTDETLEPSTSPNSRIRQDSVTNENTNFHHDDLLEIEESTRVEELFAMPIRIIMHAPHFHADADSTRMHEYLVMKIGSSEHHSHFSSHDSTRLYSDLQDFREIGGSLPDEDVEAKLWSMTNVIYNKDESPGLYGEVADFWRGTDSQEVYDDAEDTERPEEEQITQEARVEAGLWKKLSATNNASPPKFNIIATEKSTLSGDDSMTASGTTDILQADIAHEIPTEKIPTDVEEFNPEEEETRNKLIAHYSKLLPWIYYVLEK